MTARSTEKKLSPECMFDLTLKIRSNSALHCSTWLDQGSNPPGAYGVGVTLMEDVAESLPWGILDYNETEDDIWLEEENIDKPYNRASERFHSRYQLPPERSRGVVHQSTREALFSADLRRRPAAWLPRNMHRYDSLIKELKSFGGLPGRMPLSLLPACPSLARHADSVPFGRMQKNLTPWQDTEDNETEKDEDQIVKLKNEIKRLRSALHESDRASRDLAGL